MRKLASIRTIEDVRPIPDADKIELVIIDGWQVVSQKGNFQKGDSCVYFEIDSVFPLNTPVANSLPADKASKYSTDKQEVVEGFRIKTIKLRGQVSQGYALPLKYFNEYPSINLQAEDLTEELQVTKYEAPERGGLGFAQAKGNFPTNFISKSDQERIQNMKGIVYQHYLDETPFEVSYKLDGSSITVGRYQDAEQLQEVICSRNQSLKLDYEVCTSKFVINGKPILEKLVEKDLLNIALQGELIGPGIQGNFENVPHTQVHIYSVWDVKKHQYLNPTDAKVLVEDVLNLKYVPLMFAKTTLKEMFGNEIKDPNELLEVMLAYAQGPSGLNGKYREGFVYKSLDNSFSFKTVSNQYLLKEK